MEQLHYCDHFLNWTVQHRSACLFDLKVNSTSVSPTSKRKHFSCKNFTIQVVPLGKKQENVRDCSVIWVVLSRPYPSSGSCGFLLHWALLWLFARSQGTGTVWPQWQHSHTVQPRVRRHNHPNCAQEQGM